MNNDNNDDADLLLSTDTPFARQTLCSVVDIKERNPSHGSRRLDVVETNPRNRRDRGSSA